GEGLAGLGVEPARITIVGDEPSKLEPAIREGLEADLLVLSGGLRATDDDRTLELLAHDGGLGPTHDDRTVELLAQAAGLGLRVIDELAAEIEGISRGIAERFGRPYAE